MDSKSLPLGFFESGSEQVRGDHGAASDVFAAFEIATTAGC